MRGSVVALVAVTLLALCWTSQARPHKNHKVSKRETHDLLKAVQQELTHAKRHRRGSREHALSRVKREDLTEQAEEEEPALSRMKRNRRDADEPVLQRAKRHRRNVPEDEELSRQKRGDEGVGENKLVPETTLEKKVTGEDPQDSADETGDEVQEKEKEHHGHKHDRDCKESKKFKHIVKKAMRKAKKSRSNHAHKKKDGQRSSHRKQSKSKSPPDRKKLKKDLSKFERLGRELTHGVSKLQMKHARKFTKSEKSGKHFKRAKRSKHARHHK